MDQFSCSNCFNLKPEKTNFKSFFKKKSNKGRKSLLVTLITIVLNIEKMFGFYCFCSTKGKFSICSTSEKFKGKHLLYQNCSDFKQDVKIVGNLLKVLKDLVSLNNHFVCGLINHKYYYTAQN